MDGRKAPGIVGGHRTGDAIAMGRIGSTARGMPRSPGETQAKRTGWAGLKGGGSRFRRGESMHDNCGYRPWIVQKQIAGNTAHDIL